MASILEGAIWTVTEEVADHMVETGLLVKCEANHIGIEEYDKPVYHISPDAPSWFGFSTIAGAINSATKAWLDAKTE